MIRHSAGLLSDLMIKNKNKATHFAPIAKKIASVDGAAMIPAAAAPPATDGATATAGPAAGAV